MDIFKRVASLTKKEAKPLKKLKIKIKIQEATDSFKNYKRFTSYLGSIELYHLYFISIS
jgi:hypothetical protein